MNTKYASFVISLVLGLIACRSSLNTGLDALGDARQSDSAIDIGTTTGGEDASTATGETAAGGSGGNGGGQVAGGVDAAGSALGGQIGGNFAGTIALGGNAIVTGGAGGQGGQATGGASGLDAGVGEIDAGAAGSGGALSVGGIATGGVIGNGGWGGGKGGAQAWGGTTAPPCPANPPTDGSSCSQFPEMSCIYQDCAGAGRTIADCEKGAWKLIQRKCSPQKCENKYPGGTYPTCAAGEVCYTWAADEATCVVPTCGTGPITFDCVPGTTGYCRIDRSWDHTTTDMWVHCQSFPGTGH